MSHPFFLLKNETVQNISYDTWVDVKMSNVVFSSNIVIPDPPALVKIKKRGIYFISTTIASRRGPTNLSTVYTQFLVNDKQYIQVPFTDSANFYTLSTLIFFYEFKEGDTIRIRVQHNSSSDTPTFRANSFLSGFLVN